LLSECHELSALYHDLTVCITQLRRAPREAIMSLTLKIGSLVIRTLAKPIGNYIKRNAREHEGFRRYCVGFAQGLHRIDMRLRLGLLQDQAVIERQIQREAKEAEARRRLHEAPTVKTEAEAKADEALSAEEKKKISDKLKQASKPRIRPLSEAKAIDTGANFISEAFLFLVAGGLIVAESLRSRWKESNRREDVADRLDLLQSQVEELLAKNATLEQQVGIKGTISSPEDEQRKKASVREGTVSAATAAAASRPETKEPLAAPSPPPGTTAAKFTAPMSASSNAVSREDSKEAKNFAQHSPSETGQQSPTARSQANPLAQSASSPFAWISSKPGGDKAT